MTKYFAARLFDGQQIQDSISFTVEQGVITKLSQNDASNAIRLSGLVTAGFIDTQVNGGGGILFNHEQSVDALKTIFAGHSKFGTTGMLPTLITDNNLKMQQAANAVCQALQENVSGILGIHFEGPHLSLSKKGIHPESQIRSVSDADLAVLTRKDLGKVLVTLAPENIAPDVITDLVKQGVIVSLGHSNADIDTVLAAIDAGATGFTHLFNAMSGLKARDPGMIAAALNDSRVSCGLIADLHHVHPYNCRLAFNCIGPKRLMLVTDAMAHVGTDMQTLAWQNNTITRHGSKLSLDNGDIAGSCLDMASAVCNMHTILGGHLEDILNMAAKAPANFLGLENKGQLKVGQQADFVVLDKQFNTNGCWVKGKQVWGEVNS